MRVVPHLSVPCLYDDEPRSFEFLAADLVVAL
jgi:hypothetical protein